MVQRPLLAHRQELASAINIMEASSFLAALGLAAVHVFAGKLQCLPQKARKFWLSLTGGFTVAFVMLYLLPELAQRQEDLAQATTHPLLSWLDHHVYILALIGVLGFYGLERLAKHFRAFQQGHSQVQEHQPNTPQAHHTDTARPWLFWAHVSSFAAYNLVIGYLVLMESSSWGRLALFFIAIALHFVVLDFSLRQHYPGIYHRTGRWILAAAVLLGWAIGVWMQIPVTWVSIGLAFLSGGIILNVLKEELPEEKQSHYWPFLCGAAVYTTIVMAHASLVA